MHSLSKESVVPGSVDADIEVAKATEGPETEFVEVDKLFSSWKAGTRLGNSVMAAVVKAGQQAQAPKGFKDPTIKFPSTKKVLTTKQMQLTQYKKNCLTLKAFAMNVADQVADLDYKALNVLKPIILSVAEKGDCVKQLDAEFAKLKADKNIMLKDSIAKAMTDTIEKEMKTETGILLWRTLEFHNAGCQLDPVECLKISKEKMTGAQYVYVDANRVGWSGLPMIFHRVSVPTHAILDTVHKLKIGEENLVKNGLASDKKKPPFLTPAQGKELKLWNGSE